MKNIKQFNKPLLVLSISSIMMGLTACGGGGGGDDGTVTNLQMSGAVVDGFNANAKIWVDQNGNQLLDNDERFRWTDAYGYFSERPSINGNAAINYCADPKDTTNYTHCLKIPSDSAALGHQICSTGGVDQLTGKQYRGTMCSPIDATTGGLTVTPLTTIVNALTDAELGNLSMWVGYTSGNTETDGANFRTALKTINTFEDATGIGNFGVDTGNYDRLFKVAFQAHKIAETIAAKIAKDYNTGTSTNIDGAILVPTVLVVIAKELLASGSGWNGSTDPFSDSNKVDVIGTDTLNQLKGNTSPNYTSLGLTFADLPAGYGTSLITNLNTNLNCVLDSETSHTGTYNKSGDGVTINCNVTNTNPVQSAQAAEAATERTITEEATANPTPGNLNTAFTNNQTLSGSDVKFLDFKSALANIDAAGFDVNAYTLTTDQDLPLEDTTQVKYIGAESGNEKYYLFFTDSKAGDGSLKGVVNTCFIRDGQSIDALTGTYEVDRNKKFSMLINFLGKEATVNNLKPYQAYTSTNGGTSSCAASSKSCISVDYDDGNGLETNYFGSTTTASNAIMANYTASYAINSTLCGLIANNDSAVRNAIPPTISP